MRILVTGGAGFIGSHLVDRLIREGHHVVVLDNFSTGNRDFVNPQAVVEEADITDNDAVARLFVMHEPEAVFHMAALVDLRASLHNSDDNDAVNVEGSKNVIRAAAAHNVRAFVFSSTAAVYGPTSPIPVQESTQPEPVSPYGQGKFKIEEYLKTSGLAAVAVLRYANVYGPRQGTVGEGGVVAVFCKQLAEGEPLSVFGDGTQTRDFVFVLDIVEANMRALTAGLNFTVCNVGTGHETSVNEIANILLRISEKNSIVKHLKKVEGEVLRSALDNHLITSELGWKPRIMPIDGLLQTWEWFEKHYI